jgi:hypothetical protein
VYIVSDQPSTVPDVRFIYSTGAYIEEGNPSPDSRLPTDKDIQVISTKNAAKLFGTGAHIIDGVSVRFFCLPISSSFLHLFLAYVLVRCQ